MSGDNPFGLTRRQILAGASAALVPTQFAAQRAQAQEWRAVSITFAESPLALRAGAAESKVTLTDPALLGRFRPNDALQLRLKNAASAPATIAFRGVGRLPSAVPLLARRPVAPGAEDTINFRTALAGTMLAELTPVGGGMAARSAFVVEEAQPPQVDRDEVMLIEEWRVRADGTLAAPGSDPGDAAAVFTVNRKVLPEIAVRRFERLRFRFINGSQRSVMALRIENANAQLQQGLRVMAIDSRPSEPFPARNGQIALAPTSRLDAFADMSGEAGSTATLLLHDGVTARPLAKLVHGPEPMRGAPLAEPAPLPETPSPRPDLRTAQRAELVFNGANDPKAWLAPENLLAAKPLAAFTARRGRTVSLALVNRTPKPAIFKLGRHAARLLDRLDDGWKPYWVDTIPVDAGQTQRIAFVPEDAGAFLIEAFAPEWTSPLFARCFAVE